MSLFKHNQRYVGVGAIVVMLLLAGLYVSHDSRANAPLESVPIQVVDNNGKDAVQISYLSFDELIEEADLIIEGTVAKVEDTVNVIKLNPGTPEFESFASHGTDGLHIESHLYTIDVRDTLKGRIIQNQIVLERGGILDSVEPSLGVGDHLILFAEKASGRIRAVHPTASYFLIRENKVFPCYAMAEDYKRFERMSKEDFVDAIRKETQPAALWFFRFLP